MATAAATPTTAAAAAVARVVLVTDHLVTGVDDTATAGADAGASGAATPTSSNPTSLPTRNPAVVVLEGGRIVAVHTGAAATTAAAAAAAAATSGGRDRVVHAPVLTPGFVDIHNHGIGGATHSVCEYFLSDASARALPAFGVTTFLASLTFPADNQPLTDRVIASVEQQVQRAPWDGPPSTPSTTTTAALVAEAGGRARVGGIHAEGPVIATLGGLPPSDRDMSLRAFERLCDAMPSLRVMTISPSLEAALGTGPSPTASGAAAAATPAAGSAGAGATAAPVRVPYERLRALLKRGVRPAIGHDTVCNEQHIVGALRVAADEFGGVDGGDLKQLHMTHCFNVSQFHHRNVSLVNFGLLQHFPEGFGTAYRGLVPPTIELIGDLVHVHPLALTHALQCKPARDLALVSDAIMAATDPTPKEYSGRIIEVCCGCAAAGASHAANAANAADANADVKTANTTPVAAPKHGPYPPAGGDATANAKRVVVKGSDTLYGGCASSLALFHNAVRVCGVPLARAVQSCTSTPARIARLRDVGRIAVGCHADVLLFDADLTLRATFIAGRVAWAAPPNTPHAAEADAKHGAAHTGAVDTHAAQSSNATRTDHSAQQIAQNELALKQLQQQAAAAAAASASGLARPVTDADR